jgi:para-aminobenzoate synthetase component I
MQSNWTDRNCAPLSVDEALSAIRCSRQVIDLADPKRFSSCGHKGPWQFNRLVGLGSRSEFRHSSLASVSKLKNWLDHSQDLVMGWFSYDLKNVVEQLWSRHVSSPPFALYHFVVPEHILMLNEGQWSIYYHGDKLPALPAFSEKGCSLSLGKPHLPDRERYVRQAESILRHIQLGDIYEANLCVRGTVDSAVIDPALLFEQMTKESGSPFSCRVACDGQHLLSASPERFMTKTGKKVVSQPMKGTNRRKPDNEAAMLALAEDQKERIENIMITDLVRNDLSRHAAKGSVRLEQLCEVFPFQHVNQMVSTVSCELKDGAHPLDMILGAFPMGSMTGAPKVRAMQLIDEHEDFARGLFSGSVGYFTPELDFDFNVTIRSILYDEHRKKLSFPTGSAITAASNPDLEFEECMLKAESTLKMLMDHVAED